MHGSNAESYSFLLHSVARDDYTPINSQPVTFSFDSSQMCVAITIIDDLTVEPNERFTVMLESTDPAVQLIFSTAPITILDSGEYFEYMYMIGISCMHKKYLSYFIMLFMSLACQ